MKGSENNEKQIKLICIILIIFIMYSLMGTSMLASQNSSIDSLAIQKTNNVNKIIDFNEWGNNIPNKDYPFTVTFEYIETDDCLKGTFIFNPLAVDNIVSMKIYTHNKNVDEYVFNNNVNTQLPLIITDLHFFNEYVFSIKSGDSIYVGSFFFAYPTDNNYEEIMYDLMINKIDILPVSLSLNAFDSQIINENIDKTVKINAETIMNNKQSQLFYIENNCDEVTYFFDVEEGGYANIQLFTQNQDDEYIVELYNNVNAYDNSMDDVLIKRFKCVGNTDEIPVFFHAGKKLLKIIRQTNSNMDAAINPAYSILINELKFFYVNNETDNGIDTITYYNELPIFGSPLIFNANAFIGSERYNCYAYALNYYKGSIYQNYDQSHCMDTDTLGNWFQFWVMVGSFDLIDNNITTPAQLAAALIEDANADGNDAYSGVMTYVAATGQSTCPSGTYKIAIAYTSDMSFYHFYRQNSLKYDAFGRLDASSKAWSEKPGYQTGNIDFLDEDGHINYCPYLCNRGVYVNFCKRQIVPTFKYVKK